MLRGKWVGREDRGRSPLLPSSNLVKGRPALANVSRTSHTAKRQATSHIPSLPILAAKTTQHSTLHLPDDLAWPSDAAKLGAKIHARRRERFLTSILHRNDAPLLAPLGEQASMASQLANFGARLEPTHIRRLYRKVLLSPRLRSTPWSLPIQARRAFLRNHICDVRCSERLPKPAVNPRNVGPALAATSSR